LTTSRNAESNDSDLAYADALPEPQATLADIPEARQLLAKLAGDNEQHGFSGKNSQGQARRRANFSEGGAYPEQAYGGLETENEDFSAADFFEAYAAAIEASDPRSEALEVATTPEARQTLLDTIRYFKNPSSNIRLWPQKGLYVFAMLADINVASNALGVLEDDLRRALRQREPNFSWETWRAFGIAILADVSNAELRYEFGLSAMTVYKWRKVLTGTTSPGRRVAA
jgi:hypothetical protein